MEQTQMSEKEAFVVSLIAGIEADIDDTTSDRRKFRRILDAGCSSLTDEVDVLRALLRVTEDLSHLQDQRKAAIDMAHHYHLDPRHCFEKAAKFPKIDWLQDIYDKQEEQEPIGKGD